MISDNNIYSECNREIKFKYYWVTDYVCTVIKIINYVVVFTCIKNDSEHYLLTIEIFKRKYFTFW